MQSLVIQCTDTVMIYLLLLALTLLIVYRLSVQCVKPYRFPPGPPRLPLVGSLPFIVSRKTAFHDIRALAKRYGKLVGFYVCNAPYVLVSDYDILKELLNSEATAGRPALYPNNAHREGAETLPFDQVLGILMSSGDTWKEQRRFVLRNLRDLGLGKQSTEEMINGEVQKYIAKLKEVALNKPYNMSKYLFVSIFNVLWHFIAGEDHDLDDPIMGDYVELICRIFKGVTMNVPWNQVLPIPDLVKLPGLSKLSGYQLFKEIQLRTRVWFKQLIQKHLETFDINNKRDLIDMYIEKIGQTGDETSSFHGGMGYASLINVMLDLLIAGMETSTSSLLWSFLLLLHYPEAQEKLAAEILKVIGPDRMATLEDQKNMPFTNSFIQESLRHTGLVFFSLPHQATADIKVGDYVIPANTTIMSNLFDIMRDPELFDSPDEFRADRFLDEQGRFKQDEHVIPYSVGKRKCPGVPLAEKELFLYLVGIVQAFKLTSPSGQMLPSLEVKDATATGIGRFVPDFDVILTLRCDPRLRE